MTNGTETRAHVLIVDDDPSTVLLLAHLLEPVGVIHVTTRGSQALELAAAVRPDVILLDIEMPDGYGLELCRQVKAHPDLSKFVAVLPLEASSLHHAANDGRVKQFLKGSWGDIIAKATSRRVTKLAGEEKIGRTVELHQLVKLVRINVSKVDLGPRRRRRQGVGLGIFFPLTILVIPTAITTRAHFFC